MKLASLSLLLAVAAGLARAITIDSSAVAPPEDVVGEHQTLQRSWTISSVEELEKLHVLVPGRVFVDLEENLAAVVPAAAPKSAEETAKPTLAPATPVVVVVTSSASGSGSTGADSDDDEIVFTSSSSSSSSASGSADSADEIVFPVPAATAAKSPAPTPAATKTQALKKIVPVIAVAEETDDGSSSLEGSSSGSGSGASVINVGDLTTQLRRRELKDHDSDDDSSDDKKSKKKHHKPTENVIAKIIVTGNSSALLALFEVIPLHPTKENGLKLHLANADASVEGFVLTQIIIKNKNYLRHLSTVLADDVVVGDGVFVEDDKETAVKIATSGAGSVFVHSSASVTLDSLSIDVAGEGSVQIQVPALRLEDTLDANVAGSGKIALLANASFKSTLIKAAVSGDGSLVVETEKLKAEELTAAVYGSGSASFASAGNVTAEKLTLSGSGKLLVGSIVAERSSVSVWGSGDVIVQATDKLKVSTSFSGSVGYVNERPAHVKTSKWLFWRSDIVHPVEENTVAKYDVVAAPARYPLYYSLVTKQVFYAEDPIVKVTTGASQSYLAAVTTHLSTVAHGPNGFLIFSMVATTLVAVGLAVNSFQKRRIRRHYRPLVWQVSRTFKHKEPQSPALDKFKGEIKRQAQFSHPNVVKFFGIVWSVDTHLVAVTEFMARGDLRQWLHRYAVREAGRWSVQKVQILLDVAKALLYLHSMRPALVHGNCNSRNVLLNERMKAKLSDFGSSKDLLSERELMAYSAVGSGRWISPEALVGRESKAASQYGGAVDAAAAADVYSLGILMSEMDTHELPFSDLMQANKAALPETDVLQLIAKGALSPTLSPTCHPRIGELIECCTAFSPKNRPSSREVVHALQQIVQELKSEAAGDSGDSDDDGDYHLLAQSKGVVV